MSLTLNLGNHYQTAGTQKYAGDGGIWLRGYQTNQTLLSNYAYWDNSSVYPITQIATGVVVVTNITPPTQTSQTAIWDPANGVNSVPRVGENRSYATITADAANDGASIPVTWNLTNDGTTGVASAVIRSTAGTAVSGKIVLQSTSGNSSTYAFTTNADSNWQTITWTPQVLGNGVTLTGVPAFSGITSVNVTLNTISTSVDVALISTANNQMLVLGNPFAISLRNIDSADFKMGLEATAREAYQQQYGMTATAKKPTFTIETTLQNDFIKALFSGVMLKNGSYYKTTVINSANVNNQAISGSGTLVNSSLIGKPTPFAEVRIGANEFLQLWTGSLATLPGRGYYAFTSSTGTLTFGASYYGQVPEVIVDDLVSGDYYQDVSLQLGYYVRIDQKEIALDNGTPSNSIFPRAIMQSLEKSSDPANDKIKMTFAVLPSGTNQVYMQQSR
jgi:hypothetical protein